MSRIVVSLAFVLVCSTASFAQSSEDSVKAVITKLFDGMRNADTQALREVFADSLVLQTISQNREGKLVIRTESPASFIDFVSQVPKGAADEQIRFETIKIDGPLATAWTPYKFYYNKKFSHCGVNSFQLVRFEGKWKIQYLIDTRRKAGCD